MIKYPVSVAIFLIGQKHIYCSLVGNDQQNVWKKYSTDFLQMSAANFTLGGKITGTDKPILRDQKKLLKYSKDQFEPSDPSLSKREDDNLNIRIRMNWFCTSSPVSLWSLTAEMDFILCHFLLSLIEYFLPGPEIWAESIVGPVCSNPAETENNFGVI